ncbi:MAG: hypothetical protein HYZ71_10560 [Deltaproteobacteria bacterium]|nr:hypothetical protein [Deltaproteobacteria bacterium]
MRAYFLFILAVAGTFSAAETNGASNPFAGQTVYQGGSSSPAQFNQAGGSPSLGGSGIAGGVFNGVRTDPNSIGAVLSGQDGRADKAKESKQDAANGANAAIAAGTAMISSGAPMIPVPIIPVMVAGIILVTNGAIELAQGAASNSASQQNKAAEQALRFNEEQGKTASSSSAANNAAFNQGLKDKFLTPDLRQALERAGTNPEQFANEMLSNNGANATEENVARALGVSSETLAQGKAEGALNLVADELAKSHGAAVAALTSSHGGDEALRGVAGSSPSGTGLSDPAAIGAQAVGNAKASGTAKFGALPPQVVVTPPSGSQFLSNLFTQAGGTLEPGQFLGRNELMSIGIQSPFKRNIFQIARGEYRNFSQWRSGY